MVGVVLRPIDDGALDALFEQMRDPESVWMATFTAQVLRRAGFATVGTEVSYANARNGENRGDRAAPRLSRKGPAMVEVSRRAATAAPPTPDGARAGHRRPYRVLPARAADA